MDRLVKIRLTELLSIAIESAVRSLVIVATLICGAGVLRWQFPTLDLNQLGVAIAFAGLFIEILGRWRSAQQAESDRRSQELSQSLERIGASLEALKDRFELHEKLYSHPEIAAEFRQYQERVLANSAQVGALQYSLELQERLATLEARVK